jgi:hypothetical protein
VSRDVVLADPMLAHPAKRIVPTSVAIKITMFKVRDVLINDDSSKIAIVAIRDRLAIFLFAARWND